MKTLLHRGHSGFTLLEIIMTLLLICTMSTIFLQVFGSSFVQSTRPGAQLSTGFDLQQTMEEITEAHKSGASLADLQEHINNKDYGDGNYTVEENRFIKFGDDKKAVDDDTATNNMLLVTLKKDSGEMLTTLFVAGN